MSLAQDIFMQKSVFKGSFVLILSGIICKALGAFFKIPLTNILGIKGIGVFQMIMSIYSFALILCSGGMTITLSKLFSQARAKNDETLMRGLYKKSISISVWLGIIVGLILFLFAKKIAFLQGEVMCLGGYRVMIFLLPTGGIIACLRGIIQGTENMTPTAISQIIEQSVKFLFGLLLAYFLLPYGLEYGALGAVLGIFIGEVFACVYLYFKSKKLTKNVKNPKSEGFVKAYIPIMLTSLILPLSNAVDSFIIINMLVKAEIARDFSIKLFGMQTGIVSAVLNLPLIISTSMAATLLPKISTINEQELSHSLSYSFKVLWIINLPMVLGIVAVAKQLYTFVYPNMGQQMIEYAVNLTKLGAVSTIIFAVMQYLTTILQARGKLMYLLFCEFFASVVKVLTVIFLCSNRDVNIYGLVIANILFGSILCISCLLKLKKYIGLSYFDLFVPVISSLIMMLCVFKLSEILDFSLIVNLVILVLIGIVCYTLLCFPCLYFTIKEKIGNRNVKEA